MGYKRAVLQSFKRTVSGRAIEFQDNGQKDAHEFLSCVLEQLRSVSPRLTEIAVSMGMTYTCPVQAFLMFKMQSTRTCKGCGKKSSMQEDFTNISLDLVPGGSVSLSLQQYLMETELEYRCDCGAKTSGLQCSFMTLPRVLILHLKRFRYAAGRLEKVREPVLLCRQLQVAPGPSGDSAGPQQQRRLQDQNRCQASSHTQQGATLNPTSPPPATACVSRKERETETDSRNLVVRNYSLNG